MSSTNPTVKSRGLTLPRGVEPAVLIAFGCILLLLVVGAMYSRNFLSATYLLQQLKVASFLGVIATGTMLVILLGLGTWQVQRLERARASCRRHARH